MPAATTRAVGRVQTVQRWIQQTIRDIKHHAPKSFQRSEAYHQGWSDACNACIEAFNDPLAVEDVVSVKGSDVR